MIKQKVTITHVLYLVIFLPGVVLRVVEHPGSHTQEGILKMMRD